MLNDRGIGTARGGPAFLTAAFLTAMLLAACSTGNDAATTTAPAPATSSSATTEEDAAATTKATDDAAPDPDADPVDVAFDAVLDLLNDPAPSVETVEALFNPAFLAQVPAEQLLATIPQVTAGATGPWTADNVQIQGLAGTAKLEASGANPIAAQLQLDPESPTLIAGLLFQPLPDLPELESFDEVVAALDALAPTARLGLYEIVDGSCSAVEEHNTAEPMPVGSVFKLWILAELAAQIEAGEASWDELLAVEDHYKASPDGEIFSLDEGEELPLRRYAELMISISDNSATDHLLHRLGRERVEAAMTASGVADPSLNVPFLAAADLFVLKFDPESPTSADYRALDDDDDGRRAVLDELANATVPWIGGAADFPLENADGVPITDPRDHDLEWFATAEDLCRTHAHLADLAARPGLEPVGEILSINATAGMQFDRSVWTDLRYKGGSEPGVVAVAWWLERADGRTFVLAGGVEDPDAPIDPVVAVGTLQQGVNPLATAE
ncbi:MAG: serine hydrolase [Acidimicrobiales bacterium]